MQIKHALAVVSAYLVNTVLAQSVVGTHEIAASTSGSLANSVTPLGPMIPDISVAVGWTLSEQSAAATQAPDVSVPGPWTMTADSGATQTVCYELSGSIVGTDIVTPTLVNDSVPQGAPYRCWQVYQTGGGVAYIPLPTEASASSHTNKAITVALPIVLSLVGVAAIIGGIFVFMRLRSRRAAKANREWVNRPGGWAQGGAHVEEGTAPKF